MPPDARDFLNWLVQPSVLAGVAVLVIVVRNSLRLVRPEQRLVVERLGRYHRLEPPGTRFVIPFVERTIAVDPAQLVPAWNAYSEEQLEKKLREAFYSRLAPAPVESSEEPREGETDKERRQRAVHKALEAAEEAARAAALSKRR